MCTCKCACAHVHPNTLKRINMFAQGYAKLNMNILLCAQYVHAYAHISIRAHCTMHVCTCSNTGSSPSAASLALGQPSFRVPNTIQYVNFPALRYVDFPGCSCNDTDPAKTDIGLILDSIQDQRTGIQALGSPAQLNMFIFSVLR